jgi:rhodanese-related sulfurtransferase
MNRLFYLKMMRKSLAAGVLLGVLARPCIPLTLAADPVPPKAAERDFQHVDAKQAHALIADKKVLVLDIRTPGEFSKGRIAGAKNIDFQAADFEQRIDELDKTKSYLVHCASGGRSSRSLLLFKKHEFRSIYHLDGGIKAWEKAGLPTEK